MKRIISLILLTIIAISIFVVNCEKSFARDYSEFYQKNSEVLLEDIKYISVDNYEDMDALREYELRWRDAFGPAKTYDNPWDQGILVTDKNTGTVVGSGDYNYCLRFITPRNFEDSIINNILSKYDTKYLFKWKYSDEFVDQNIKYYIDNASWRHPNLRDISVDYETIKQHFNGDRDELVELMTYIYNKGIDPIGFPATDKELQTYIPLYYSDTLEVGTRFLYGEKGYRVRFRDKDECLQALDELQSHKQITIQRADGRELIPIQDNSIAIHASYKYFIKDDCYVKKSDIATMLKQKLSEYTELIIAIYDNQNSGDEIIIENINESDFDTIFSILEELCNNMTTETDLQHTIWITSNSFIYDYLTLADYFDAYQEGGKRLYDETSKIFRIKEEKTQDNGKIYSTKLSTDKFVDFVNELVNLNENDVIFPIEFVKKTPIYRLYNKNTGEHLFTSKENEYDKLGDKGWEKEGTTFKANLAKNNNSKGVYRVYNPNAKGGDHHYTKSFEEASKLVSKGWKWDNNGEIMFYSSGEKEVYRLYNKNNGRHHYTPKKAERDKLIKLGWKDEGIGWYAQ